MLYFFDNKSRKFSFTMKKYKLNYKLLFYISILLFVICLILFQYFYQIEKQNKFEEIQSHQKLHAKQAIKSFEEMFNNWNGLLSYLTNDKKIKEMNFEGKKLINKIYDIYKNDLKGITRTDKNGIITYTIPYYPNTIGRDISKQKHMIKLLDNHKPVCSDVFKSVQGYDAIVIHYPIFKNNKYDGSLAFIFNFQNITHSILSDIKIGEKGKTWLITSEGYILYSNETFAQNKSIYQVFINDSERLLLAKKMLTGKEGEASLNHTKTGDTYLTYFVPIKILNSFWSLGISYSESEMTSSLSNFRKKLLFLFSIIFLGGIFSAYFGIKGWIIVKEESARIKAEQDAKKSETRYKSLFENINVSLFQTNINFELIKANQYFIQLFMYNENEIYKIPFGLLFNNNDDKAELKDILLKQGSIKSKELLMVKKNGDKFWASINAILLKDENENNTSILGSIRDITERKDYIDILKKHIEDKDLLINEVFHRTKNNLQVIISMLELQSLLSDDLKIQNIFSDMIKRLHVMSIAHKQLFQRDDLSKISFKNYIEEIFYYLSDYYKDKSNSIELRFDIDDFDILFDLALPCGLLFNEIVNFLIINSKDDSRINLNLISKKEEETIFIKLKSDFYLNEKDNLLNDNKFGLGLFFSLVENQLNTTIKKSFSDNFTIDFSFKENLYNERI